MSNPEEELDVVELFNEYTKQVHSVIVEEDEGPDWEFTKLVTTEFQLQSALVKLLHEVRAVRSIQRVQAMLQKTLTNGEEILAILKAKTPKGDFGLM
jgi:hypothetical protein